MAGDATLDDAAWYRFVAPTGDSKSSALLGAAPAARACGTDAPGWLASAHPVAGDPPAEEGVSCVRLVRLLGQKTVHMCACSFDGGATAVYTCCRRRPTRAASRIARRATRRPGGRRRRRRRSTRGSGGWRGGRRHVRADAQLEPRPPVPHADAGRRHHSGAHVDTVTESTTVVRTPAAGAAGAAAGERRLRRDALGLRWHGNESDAFSGDAAHQQGGVGFLPLRQVEQFNQGEARERLEHWGQPSACTWRRCTRTTKSPTSTRSGRRRAWRRAARTSQSSAAALTSSWPPRRRVPLRHHGGGRAPQERHARPLRVAAGAAVGRALLRSRSTATTLRRAGRRRRRSPSTARRSPPSSQRAARCRGRCDAGGAGLVGAGGMGYDASGAAVDPRCRFGGVWAVVHEMSAVHAVCRPQRWRRRRSARRPSRRR